MCGLPVTWIAGSTPKTSLGGCDQIAERTDFLFRQHVCNNSAFWAQWFQPLYVSIN
ncbi:hypothetical protein RBSH_01649 [Rhodopirellula baltica SH28]|uniref:Uncharacterized protein n=1 Tax=Rhodopirellula baltica SH28 TaxID=993517 RepID=K5D886_RHOBT|nr:hypothetical protein RBSH_01649 [Rhodopirellula baltica SH28]